MMLDLLIPSAVGDPLSHKSADSFQSPSFCGGSNKGFPQKDVMYSFYERQT
jgi:hypothetical protein